MLKLLNHTFWAVVIIFLVSFESRSFAANITPDQWVLLKRGDIINRVEPVRPGEERGVAIGIVDAPPAEVWKVIHENNDFKRFMPSMLESILIDPSVIPQVKALKFDYTTGDPKELIQLLKKHRIEKMIDTTGYFFSLLSVPWSPVHKWYVVKLEDTVTNDRWFQNWSMVIGNLKTNNGSWDLLPLEGDKTLVTYTLFVDSGGLMPAMTEEKTIQTPPVKSEEAAGGPKVIVANGCASENKADFFANKIMSAGFRVVEVGVAQTLNYKSSEVIFDGPYYNQSIEILRLIPGKQKLLKLKVKNSTYDIYVVIGCTATDHTLRNLIEALRTRVKQVQ